MRPLVHCPNCDKPLYYDIVDATFTTETTPSHTLKLQMQASWCPTPNCYQVVSPYNAADVERGLFIDEVCRARDIIRQIVEGKIERGHRRSQYDAEPGLRKLTLKDAQAQARIAVDKINKAINRFEP